MRSFTLLSLVVAGLCIDSAVASPRRKCSSVFPSSAHPQPTGSLYNATSTIASVGTLVTGVSSSAAASLTYPNTTLALSISNTTTFTTTSLISTNTSGLATTIPTTTLTSETTSDIATTPIATSAITINSTSAATTTTSDTTTTVDTTSTADSTTTTIGSTTSATTDLATTTATNATTTSTASTTTTTSSATPTSACSQNVYPKSGVLQVINQSTGATMGYVRNTYDSQDCMTYGTLDEALTVQVVWTGDACDDPTDIALTMLNGPDSANPYLGFVSGTGGSSYFETGQLGYTYMTGTSYIEPNLAPQSSSETNSLQALGYEGAAEASVWTLDIATSALSTTWTNTDGSAYNASLFYDTSVDFIGTVADMSVFSATYTNEGAYLVSLVFVETE